MQRRRVSEEVFRYVKLYQHDHQAQTGVTQKETFVAT